MKKFLAAAAVALTVSACSESTAPSASPDLGLRADKPAPPPIAVAGTLQNDFFTFAAGDVGASGTGNTTLTVADNAGITAASVPTEATPSNPSNYVLGRLNNQQVNISIAAGATNFAVAFDFYAIGSWDGRGQQAQHGTFGQDSWQIAAVCGSSLVNVFITTFSNQKTVQQNYPRQITDGGGTTWLSGSSGTNVTGFTANVPLFDAVVDSWYELSFSGLNPCSPSSSFTGLRILIPDFDLQSRQDEAWAIDNLSVKTDS
jgi:hypothetical protein